MSRKNCSYSQRRTGRGVFEELNACPSVPCPFVALPCPSVAFMRRRGEEGASREGEGDEAGAVSFPKHEDLCDYLGMAVFVRKYLAEKKCCLAKNGGEGKKKGYNIAYKENIETAEKMPKDLVAITEAVVRGEREYIV